MYTVSAKEARNEFSALIDSVRNEPVQISKNGKPVAVVISVDTFERFEMLENNYWLERAKDAQKSGYIGAKAGEKWLKDMLNAKDKSD